MAVIDPLKVTITNFEEGKLEVLKAANHPKDESFGEREIHLTREVYIDKADFREEANRKYKRLVTGGEVRLRNAYVIRADEVIKDDNGEIIELKCSYDPDTLGANPEGRKVRGVIHWVSATEGVPAEIRLYDRLFNHPAPDSDKSVADWKEHINPESLVTKTDCMVEKALSESTAGDTYQFEREGYFCRDKEESDDKIIFNRVVTLRDSWAKIEQQNKA
jgi:glutaminyl-tRNA synthetase